MDRLSRFMIEGLCVRVGVLVGVVGGRGRGESLLGVVEAAERIGVVAGMSIRSFGADGFFVGCGKAGRERSELRTEPVCIDDCTDIALCRPLAGGRASMGVVASAEATDRSRLASMLAASVRSSCASRMASLDGGSVGTTAKTRSKERTIFC